MTMTKVCGTEGRMEGTKKGLTTQTCIFVVFNSYKLPRKYKV